MNLLKNPPEREADVFVDYLQELREKSRKDALRYANVGMLKRCKLNKEEFNLRNQ